MVKVYSNFGVIYLVKSYVRDIKNEFRNYNRSKLFKDMMAGLTGAMSVILVVLYKTMDLMVCG